MFIDCLLIIDVQNDFLFGGVLVVLEGDQVVLVVNQFVQVFGCVVLMQDWYLCEYVLFVVNYVGMQLFGMIDLLYGQQVLWLVYCVQYSVGVVLVDNLDVLYVQLMVCKGYYLYIDSYFVFFEVDCKMLIGLLGYLCEFEIKCVFCVGLVIDFCVVWLVLDVCVVGLEVVVIEDVCCVIDLNGLFVQVWQQMMEVGIVWLQLLDVLNILF